MKKHIISIGRQYGCGAHEIATKLSKKLGIPYYDKEIIKRAAKDSGLDEHIFTSMTKDRQEAFFITFLPTVFQT